MMILSIPFGIPIHESELLLAFYRYKSSMGLLSSETVCSMKPPIAYTSYVRFVIISLFNIVDYQTFLDLDFSWLEWLLSTCIELYFFLDDTIPPSLMLDDVAAQCRICLHTPWDRLCLAQVCSMLHSVVSSHLLMFCLMLSLSQVCW